MNILLIGYRGSGKTTTGQILARRLGCAFADSDVVLIQRAGKTIKEIFAESGETGFRDLETAVLKDLLANDHQVLALGGGVILRDANRTMMQGPNNRIVYLKAAVEELHRRIHADVATAANRPSLTALGGGIEEIRSVLAAREPIYQQMANCVIDVTAKLPEIVATEIENAVRDMGFRLD